jgi:hypothetical protein
MTDFIILLTAVLGSLITLRYVHDHLKLSRLQLLMIQFIAEPSAKTLQAVDTFENRNDPLRRHIEPVIMRRFMAMRAAFMRRASLSKIP